MSGGRWATVISGRGAQEGPGCMALRAMAMVFRIFVGTSVLFSPTQPYEHSFFALILSRVFYFVCLSYISFVV